MPNLLSPNHEDPAPNKNPQERHRRHLAKRSLWSRSRDPGRSIIRHAKREDVLTPVNDQQ